LGIPNNYSGAQKVIIKKVLEEGFRKPLFTPPPRGGLVLLQ